MEKSILSSDLSTFLIGFAVVSLATAKVGVLLKQFVSDALHVCVEELRLRPIFFRVPGEFSSGWLVVDWG